MQLANQVAIDTKPLTVRDLRKMAAALESQGKAAIHSTLAGQRMIEEMLGNPPTVTVKTALAPSVFGIPLVETKQPILGAAFEMHEMDLDGTLRAVVLGGGPMHGKRLSREILHPAVWREIVDVIQRRAIRGGDYEPS